MKIRSNVLHSKKTSSIKVENVEKVQNNEA
jgi:hypothetical protein